MQWPIECTWVECSCYKSTSTKDENVRAKRAKNMENFNNIYRELRPLFQKCNDLFRSRGETSGSQVILCTLKWSSIGTNVGTEKPLRANCHLKHCIGLKLIRIGTEKTVCAYLRVPVLPYHSYHEMRPIFQQCNNPVWVKWRCPLELNDVVHFSGLRLHGTNQRRNDTVCANF